MLTIHQLMRRGSALGGRYHRHASSRRPGIYANHPLGTATQRAASMGSATDEKHEQQRSRHGSAS